VLDKPFADTRSVPLIYVELADAYADWLASHARAIYSTFGVKEMNTAILILEKIRHGDLGANGFLTGPEVYAPPGRA
jgi:hypothetical protein